MTLHTFLCNKVVPVIRMQVLNVDLIPANPACHSDVCIFSEHTLKGLVCNQAEFLSQRVKNEAVYKNFDKISD